MGLRGGSKKNKCLFSVAFSLFYGIWFQSKLFNYIMIIVWNPKKYVMKKISEIWYDMMIHIIFYIFLISYDWSLVLYFTPSSLWKKNPWLARPWGSDTHVLQVLSLHLGRMRRFECQTGPRCWFLPHQMKKIHIWLVVGPPLWKIWLRQVGWLETQ